ncbi:MAG: hypothetical protein Q6M04_08245 [Thermostichus sp. BF3_bins_97]
MTQFCRFFLETCIDQIEFMGSLLDPGRLLYRLESFVGEEVAAGRLLNGSYALLREAWLQGTFVRGRAAVLTGYKDRQARLVLAKLLQQGLLASDTSKGAVRLGFPVSVVNRWFLGLYPQSL